MTTAARRGGAGMETGTDRTGTGTGTGKTGTDKTGADRTGTGGGGSGGGSGAAKPAETRTQRLASDIADAILSGAFAPGARLDEQMLADRFGVSRTPVREVLRELAASGLVEMRPRRGAIVAEVDAGRLDTLFGAMAELEATCARLSAIGMAPIERRRLEALHDAMATVAAAGDEEAYAAANLRFHTLIYDGAHNAVLTEMTAGLRRRVAPFRRAQFHAAGRLARSHAEHGAVVAAIVAGDAAAAHAAMLRHVEIVEDAWESLAAEAGDGAPR